MSKNFINELYGGFIYKEDKGNQIIINCNIYKTY